LFCWRDEIHCINKIWMNNCLWRNQTLFRSLFFPDNNRFISWTRYYTITKAWNGFDLKWKWMKMKQMKFIELKKIIHQLDVFELFLILRTLFSSYFLSGLLLTSRLVHSNDLFIIQFFLMTGNSQTNFENLNTQIFTNSSYSRMNNKFHKAESVLLW